MKTPLSAVITLVVAAALPACSSDFGFGVDLTSCKDGYITPSSMSIAANVSGLRVGQTAPVMVTRSSPKETSNTCYEVPSWTSSNPAVATAMGFEIMAVGPGTAQLTATSGSVSATITVTVVDVQIASLTITAPASLLVGQVSQATVTARDSDGKPVTIVGQTVWTSSDNSTMTVGESGLLSGRNGGVVTLKVSVEGREASVTITVLRSGPVVKFSAISTGAKHTCGIAGGGAVPQGSIICWGIMLGSRISPSWMVTNGRTFKSITSGSSHSCAIATNDETFCWGLNDRGQVGDGSTSSRTDPVRISSTESFVDLAPGGSFSCGLNSSGATHCWGTLANRTSSTPAQIAGAPKFRDISAELGLVCGLTDEGEVYCIGTSQQASYTTFTRIPSPAAFVSIASSDYHTCGLTSGGSAYCWGLNASGQIGGTATLVSSPSLLPGGLTFSSIAAGSSSTCGITTEGAKCLGLSMLAGSTSSGYYSIPGEYARPLSVISSRSLHSCAIDSNGGPWCWGYNFEGQVGIPGFGNVIEPVLIVADPLR